MAVYGMKVSSSSSGLDAEDQNWLDGHPETSAAFERFCAGPVRADLLLPHHERPLSWSRATTASGATAR
jgi:hypothetical protein